ncbi:hypothetical protein A6R68_05126, partial [Neotoma lepida]
DVEHEGGNCEQSPLIYLQYCSADTANSRSSEGQDCHMEQQSTSDIRNSVHTAQVLAMGTVKDQDGLGGETETEDEPSCYVDTEPSCYVDTEPSCYVDTEPSYYVDTEPSCYVGVEPFCYVDTEPSCYVDTEPACYVGIKLFCYVDTEPCCYVDTDPSAMWTQNPAAMWTQNPAAITCKHQDLSISFQWILAVEVLSEAEEEGTVELASLPILLQYSYVMRRNRGGPYGHFWRRMKHRRYISISEQTQLQMA